MRRSCAICGTKLDITVNDDKSYSGGHFFFKIEGAEYWECDACYKEWPK